MDLDNVIRTNDTKKFKEFLKSNDPNVILERSFLNPLDKACLHNSVDIVKLLLNDSRLKISTVNHTIIYMIGNDHIASLKEILKDGRFDTEIENEIRDYIILATTRRKTDILKLFIRFTDLNYNNIVNFVTGLDHRDYITNIIKEVRNETIDELIN